MATVTESDLRSDAAAAEPCGTGPDLDEKGEAGHDARPKPKIATALVLLLYLQVPLMG